MSPSPFADLPILEDIRVASPCQANWEEMAGDNRKRFCSDCKLHVYNLSAMSRSEADAVLQNRQGRLCVRYFRRADGTVLTQDCPVGVRTLRQRLMRTMVLLATTTASLIAAAWFGWTHREPKPAASGVANSLPIESTTVLTPTLEPSNEFVMGDICLPQSEGWAQGGCPAP